MQPTTLSASTAIAPTPRAFRAVYAGTCAATGRRFYPGAEIYKNPAGRGYVLLATPVVSSAPVRAPATTAPEIKADLAHLETLYRRMDWTFEFSDDGGVHRRGYAALAHIRATEAACISAGLATTESLATMRAKYNTL